MSGPCQHCSAYDKAVRIAMGAGAEKQGLSGNPGSQGGKSLGNRGQPEDRAAKDAAVGDGGG